MSAPCACVGPSTSLCLNESFCCRLGQYGTQTPPACHCQLNICCNRWAPSVVKHTLSACANLFWLRWHCCELRAPTLHLLSSTKQFVCHPCRTCSDAAQRWPCSGPTRRQHRRANTLALPTDPTLASSTSSCWPEGPWSHLWLPNSREPSS